MNRVGFPMSFNFNALKSTYLLFSDCVCSNNCSNVFLDAIQLDCVVPLFNLVYFFITLFC